MIIGGSYPLKIGSIIRFNCAEDEKSVGVYPFFVIREATREEWLQEPRTVELSEQQKLRASYYYEVSSD